MTEEYQIKALREELQKNFCILFSSNKKNWVLFLAGQKPC